MRILVIGINYAPEESGNAPYTTGACEYLVARGHEVHILTGEPHYPGWQRDSHGLLPEYRGLINGVHVHRRWHHIPKKQSAARRGLYEASFLATGLSLALLPKPDAVLAVVPALSDGVLARLASLRFGVPYGVLFQDLMGRAAEQSGIEGAGRMHGMVKFMEGWVARGAATVAVVTDGFRGYLQSLGVPADRITGVRNWSLVPEAAIAERDATRDRLGWPRDAFVCLHAGNMGYKQGLENVIECTQLAQSEPGLFFALVGDGNKRAALVEQAADAGLDNLTFGPSLPAAAYAHALAAADVLILNQSAAVTDMAFPSKLASYLSSGTPVVAAVAPESEAGRELSRSGAGLVVQAGQPRALLDAIMQLRADAALARRLGDAGLEHARRTFSREAALAELESFVMGLAPQRVNARARLPAGAAKEAS